MNKILNFFFLFSIIFPSYSQENQKVTDSTKVTLEVLCKNKKTQFMVQYDATDSNMIKSGHQIGAIVNSGWKHISYTKDKENPITLRVSSVHPMKKPKVVLNLYIDDKLVMTEEGKAGTMLTTPVVLQYYFSN